MIAGRLSTPDGVGKWPIWSGQGEAGIKLNRSNRHFGDNHAHHPAAGKNHTTLNNDLGLAGDAPTREMFAFLSTVLKK
jgi:hypothetical protein